MSWPDKPTTSSLGEHPKLQQHWNFSNASFQFIFQTMEQVIQSSSLITCLASSWLERTSKFHPKKSNLFGAIWAFGGGGGSFLLATFGAVGGKLVANSFISDAWFSSPSSSFVICLGIVLHHRLVLLLASPLSLLLRWCRFFPLCLISITISETERSGWRKLSQTRKSVAFC